MRRLLFVVFLACSAGQAPLEVLKRSYSNLSIPPGSPAMRREDSIDDMMFLYVPDTRTMDTQSNSDIKEEFACVARDFYYDMVAFRLTKLQARTELFRRCNEVYEKLQREGKI